MNQTTSTEKSNNDLLDLLDEALSRLKAADRQALVLRYLKEQPLSDVAEKLGVSQDAARKRVDRGIEKLRQYFSRRGVATTSAALGTILKDQISGAALTPPARQAVTQEILQICHAGAQSSAASVAIAKGTKTMMILSKIKTAALVAIIFAAIGTTGWMISRARANNSPALQAAAPAVAAANATSGSPPAAAATRPAAATTAPSPIDLSTPENAARSFFIAIKDGNRANAYACLTADPKRPANLMDALISWNLAQNRLVAAVFQRFGVDAAAVKHIMTLDMVAYTIAQNPDAASDAAIDGDNATITTAVPPWLISMAPSDFQPRLRDWQDKPLYFHKQAGHWKFDIDRSMRIDARILDRNNQPLNAAAILAIFKETAQATEQIAGEVADGKITTAQAAAAALDAAVARISMNHDVSSSQFNVMPGK
jgi:hypothetical protein